MRSGVAAETADRADSRRVRILVPRLTLPHRAVLDDGDHAAAFAGAAARRSSASTS